MDAGPANGPGFCPEAEAVGGGWRQRYQRLSTASCGSCAIIPQEPLSAGSRVFPTPGAQWLFWASRSPRCQGEGEACLPTEGERRNCS